MLTAAVFTLAGLAAPAAAQEKPVPAKAKPAPAEQKVPVVAEPKRPIAPPLAEIARQELERRKAVKVPSLVFTDKDVREMLAKRPLPETPAAAAAEPAAAQPPADAAAAAAAKLAAEKDEAWWRQRVASVREVIRRNEMFADALQSRINALATDFANRDDPFQRLKIADDRQKALAELERVQTEIASGKEQLADIEEEARRAGIPPGWIR